MRRIGFISKPLKIDKPLKNESGFALVTAVLILAILTFIGLAGTNTTVFELRIAGNERQARQRFFIADSGWKQSGPYLNSHALAPPFVNLTMRTEDTEIDWTEDYYRIIRNYGEGADEITNDDFPFNERDGLVTGIPYWYRVRYESDTQSIGFGTNYRNFIYHVISREDGNNQVTARVRKVFRVGY